MKQISVPWWKQKTIIKGKIVTVVLLQVTFLVKLTVTVILPTLIQLTRPSQSRCEPAIFRKNWGKEGLTCFFKNFCVVMWYLAQVTQF
jgi:hypothetical protein